MQQQILGEQLRFSRKRTDLNETTKSKQLETQIVNINSSKQITQVALPHIVQNFQFSGLDSNDIHYTVKRAQFPSKMGNIFDGDYVEVFVGTTLYLTGFNANTGDTWMQEQVTQVMPDSTQYVGVKLFFDTKGKSKIHLNGYEVAEMLNEQMKQKVQEIKETYYDTYSYDGLPAGDFSQQIVHDNATISFFATSKFEFDYTTGKLSVVYNRDENYLVSAEHPVAYGSALDSTGTPTYLLPTGVWDGVNVEATYILQSFEVQIYPGRDLQEHRQYRLSQILGADLSQFTFNLGTLNNSPLIITESGFTIDEVNWNSTVRGTQPTTFKFYGTSPMDTTPIKRIYVYAGLQTNVWGQLGAKEGFFFAYHVDGSNIVDSSEHHIHTNFFQSKENIQGLKNGFDIVLKDEFGQDPCLMDKYYMEIAFRFHN